MMRILTILIIFAFNISLLTAQIDKSDNSNLSHLIQDFETISHNHITSTMSNNVLLLMVKEAIQVDKG